MAEKKVSLARLLCFVWKLNTREFTVKWALRIIEKEMGQGYEEKKFTISQLS